MRPSFSLFAITFILITPASAQWKDRISLGQGGESKIATDDHGNVYATCHQPCKFYVSHDWGASFGEPKLLENAMCDVDVYAWPDGRVNVVNIKNGVSGMQPWYSTDFGKTLNAGKGIDGPLDREWLAVNPLNGEVFFNYSHGYIGGPKSTGIFLAASTDGGKTFEPRGGRVDREKEGSYPVDPYLSNSSDGKIYAMWANSADFNTIDNFRFAVSNDGGKTFEFHQTIAEFNKKWGDTQERWMLGCMVATGKNTVVVFYPDYEEMSVDGKTSRPMLVHYKVSKDGGKTFGEGRTVLPKSEIESAIRSVEASRKTDSGTAIYIETMPWACADPSGRLYLAFQDNRSGQTQAADAVLNRWHVRFASCSDLVKGFVESERVSDDVACKRPPLDFLSCAADSKRAYVIWTETPNNKSDWAFSGDLYVARKILPAPAK